MSPTSLDLDSRPLRLRDPVYVAVGVELLFLSFCKFLPELPALCYPINDLLLLLISVLTRKSNGLLSVI